MRPRTTLLLFFFLLLATYTTSTSTTTNVQWQTQHLHHHHRRLTSSSSTGRCSPVDSDALLAFKQGITRDPAGRLASWTWGQGRQDDDADCCRWKGIRCSKKTNRVFAIQLGNGNALRAGDDLQHHHFWDTALAGQISPSMLSLEYLEHLDLSMNDISGPAGSVPEFLGLFKNLRHLNLSGMTFTGSVPPQLGNLSKLQFLDLSRPNLFTPSEGPSLHSNDISWLSNLAQLIYLDLSYVDLSGIVDWARVVNTVPSLKTLRLVDCSLASANESIPHLNLTGLMELRLANNYLDHPVASCWFWNFTTLEYLDLASTSLYGQMPDALGALTSLRVLDFSYGIGSIDIMTANMTNLCNLETLDLQYSNMTGDIIELLRVHCFPSRLKEVYLGGNTFTGILPDWIGNRWSSLQTLELYSNRFTGHLPSEIGMLKDLRILRLSYNQFHGPLPSEIGMLSNLHILHLHNNRFTGDLPSQIGMLSNLTTMNLSTNNFSGVITHEHFAGLPSLRTIDLSSNLFKFIVVDPEWFPPFQLEHATFASCQIGPQFPAWLRSQVGIVNLDISSTSIFDRLPDWFATTFSNASELYMSNNGINGTLPANLENMTSLHVLYLDSNRLTGPIPQLPINLYLLDISRNNLSGILPPKFGAPNLMYLGLFSNRITGHIPQYICELNLGVLDLANNCLEVKFPRCFEPRMVRVLLLNNNMLSGKLQSILETYTELQILDLAWNKFTGSIPSTISTLEGLSHLNLAGNGISGALPNHLSNLTGMKKRMEYLYDDFISGKFNVSVTIKGQQRYYYNFAIYSMVSVDLSSNHLKGEIPEEIASLDAVVNLNLSRNNLTGKFSESIGVMQSLESLDLSANKLYGEIPQSMSNLTYLSFMDLSHNNLTGKIPSGGQLDTLYSQDPLIYDDNIGLCGYPLQKNCTDGSEPKHAHQTGNDYDSKVLTFSFGLTIGYVVGLWLVFCAMLFNKSWRISYFHLLDKVYVFALITWTKWAKGTTTHFINC